MPLLVETIRSDNGRFNDLSPHIERMTRSRKVLFGIESEDRPDDTLEHALIEASGLIGEGRWKLRVLYDREIRDVEAASYSPKQIKSAALVDGRGISYACKFVDRSELEDLDRRSRAVGADTAIIVLSGRITDFSYANAAFYDGESWWTPAEPLLRGTRRSRLIEAGLIKTTVLTPADLDRFISVSPINAMLELGEIMVDIGSINREII